jgi:4-hydroxy-3-methylbut-2-enyl diphosphate reductase
MSTVKVARTAGFCKGVRRAVEKVFTIAKKTDGETVTLGPVIHNPQVLDQLKNLGIESISSPSQGCGKYVIIRAHGIPPSVREELRKHNAKICDATCPDVGKVQGIVKKYANQGYHTVIIGDSGHAEIKGIMGFTNGNGHVINSVSDVDTLPDMDKVCIVAQTTHQKDSFYEICDALTARFGTENCSVNDTICPSTIARQEEVRQLASTVDLMIVIGGKNSANTARLAKISEETGAKTIHVETDDELDAIDITQYPNIGVTAGASTPNWMIKQIVLKIKAKQRRAQSFAVRCALNLWDLIRHMNILVAFAAASLSYTVCYIQKLPSKKEYFFVSFFYILAMYIVNNIQRKSFLKLNKPAKLNFYTRFKHVLLILTVLSIITVLCLTYSLGPLTFLASVLLLALGSVYHLIAIPVLRDNKMRWRKLSQIPGSKDMIAILGWAIMVIVIPFLASGHRLYLLSNGTALMFVISTVSIRSIINDIREIQEDMMVGAETLPILLGTKRVLYIVSALVIITCLLLIISSLYGWIPLLSTVLLIPLLSIFIICLNHKRLQYAYSIDYSDIIDLFLISTGVFFYVQAIITH